MLDPYLRCATFLLPANQPWLYQDLARKWGGGSDISINTGGAAQWVRKTSLEIASNPWFQVSEPILGDAQQAILPVSISGEYAVFVFVTSFASVQASFMAALRGDLFPRWGVELRGLLTFDHVALQIDWRRRALPAGLRHIEIQADTRQRIVVSAEKAELPAGAREARIRRLHVQIGDRVIRVDDDFSFEIDGASSGLGEISETATILYGMLERYLIAVPLSAERAA